MTQKQRVLTALQRTGWQGITQVDFLAPHVIDGGKPVTRLAARILELREDGHAIRVVGERQECAVYQLEANRPVTVTDTGDGVPASLFAAPVPNAIQDAA